MFISIVALFFFVLVVLTAATVGAARGKHRRQRDRQFLADPVRVDILPSSFDVDTQQYSYAFDKAKPKPGARGLRDEDEQTQQFSYPQ